MDRDWLEQNMKDRLQDYPSGLNLEDAWKRLEKTRKQKRKRRPILLFILIGLLALAGLGYHVARPAPASVAPEPMAKASALAGPEYREDHPPESPDRNYSAKANPSGQAGAADSGKESNEDELGARLKNVSTAGLDPATVGAFAHRPAPERIGNSHTETEALVSHSPARKQTEKLETDRFTPLPVLSSSMDPIPILASYPHTVARPIHSPLPSRPAASWWMSSSIGYGIGQKQLSANDTAFSGYIDRRNRAETSEDAAYFSVHLRKTIGRQFFIQTGILGYRHFDRFVDRYTETYTETIDDQLIALHQSVNGAIEEIYGPVEAQVNKQVIKTTYNRFQRWSIPLQVGLHFPTGERWGSAISAGLAYTFYNGQQGLVFEEEHSAGQYLPLESLPYRKRGQWQGVAEMGVDYALHDKLKVSIGLQFSTDLNSAILPDAGYGERRQFLLGFIGLRKGIK